jgi:hypothetical protein
MTQRHECFTSRDYAKPPLGPMPHTGRTKLVMGCFRVLGFDVLPREAQRTVRAWQASALLLQGKYAHSRAEWRRVTPQWTKDRIAAAEGGL